MKSGIVFEFVASHHAVAVLLVLGAILVLPLAGVPLLPVQFGLTSVQQKAAA